MNYSDEHLDQLLEASGERWRASEPRLEPFSVATLLRQRQGRPSLNHFVGSTWPLAAVLVATVALLALFVAGPFGPPQHTVAPPPASPTPGGWPPALYVENRGGPAFTVSINGFDVATVDCDGGPTIAPGTSGVPQLPWDLVVTRDQDGRQLLAQQVTDLPRWFVQIGDQPLGLSDNVVMGPIPPTCAPDNPTAKPAVLTPGEAIDSVVVFVGEPARTGDLTASGPDEGAAGAFYEVRNSQLVAIVDAATGQVISIMFLGSGTPSGSGPSADEAVAIAETFLTEHGVPFDGMTRTVERKDHGETWEWVVKWVRQAGSVVLPDYREVGVDPSGQVWRFYELTQPYRSPPPAAIDQQSAETAAKEAAFGGQESQVDSTTLRLKVDSDGNQRLVWEITVSAWEPSQPSGQQPMLHAFVEVDAQSGVATVTARG